MKFSDKKNSLWRKFDETNLRLQKQCAHCLERRTSHFSRLNWIVILFCFVVITGSCSIYLIVTSFSNNTTEKISVIPITKPNNSILLEKEIIPLNGIIRSKTEFVKIIQFRRYLDSLGRSPTGKKMYDSIVQYHPGILDSLAVVENFYNSNFEI
jgi:predicted PurR-regulated permease PerM